MRAEWDLWVPDGTREESEGDGFSAVNFLASALDSQQLGSESCGMGGGAFLPEK